LNTHVKKIAVIGEAMLELSHQNQALLALSFAGDTLNFATYLRRLLSTEYFAIDYVTALGMDVYSDLMLTNWRHEGINTELIVRLPNKLPGLYLIRTDLNGERSFYFYRQNSAARDLFKSSTEETLIQALLTRDYLYLSGITLAILDEMSRERLWNLLALAKEKQIKIIFDTNYRAALWSNAETARAVINKTLTYVDIAFPTFSDEQSLFADVDPQACVQRLFKKGITEVCVKCGAESALVATMDNQSFVPACLVTEVMDTTGAGDSFNAAYFAARLRGIDPVNAARRGHQLAATVIKYPGAVIPLSAMPLLF
jgi:2-dehydro-3-deoxygluconokinase